MSSSTKPHDVMTESEESGWNVYKAEVGDELIIERELDDYREEMTVIDRTETDWTVTLLARPTKSANDVGKNPVEIKTVIKQTVGTKGYSICNGEEEGHWNGPTMAIVGQSKVKEHRWVRVRPK